MTDGLINNAFKTYEADVELEKDIQLNHGGHHLKAAWTPNQIKEEMRRKLDQDEKAARERLGQVRRELSMLAAQRDTLTIVSLKTVSNSNRDQPL